jgi:hypothetical protein
LLDLPKVVPSYRWPSLEQKLANLRLEYIGNQH